MKHIFFALCVLALPSAASAEAFFAEVDEAGRVLRVIVADQKFIDSGAVGDPSRWVQTHNGGGPLKNRASEGDVLDRERGAFIPPKPFQSWVLDEDTAQWKAPKSLPRDGVERAWDEQKKDWVPMQKRRVLDEAGDNKEDKK